MSEQKLSPLDEVPPFVNFVGLKHYTRVSNQVTVEVQSDDKVGVARVELYIDGTLIDVRIVSPNVPSILLSFNWNTTGALNGRRLVQAKSYDAAGNSQTALRVVVVQNHSVPLPTAQLTAIPNVIFFGQSANLVWITNGAASIEIDQGIGSVAPAGSVQVSPFKTVTYTLTATNATGSITKTTTLAVMPLSGNNIFLSPALRHQTIKGWEATAEAGQLYSPAWNNYKTALLDQAVNDLGINRLRVEIFSGAENPVDYYARWRAGQITESQYNANRFQIINDDADPQTINPNGFQWSQLDGVMDNLVVPMRQRLQSRGEALWLSINYVDFGSSLFEHKNNPAEYGEFVLAAYRHIQSRYGFVPDSWEIVLEPDTSNAQWSALHVAQVIKAAGNSLGVAGFTPNFVAPSTTNASNTPAYIDQIALTPGAMQYVGEFSYHRYCCASKNVLLEIVSRATLFNKNTAMLEWIGADYNTLHEDLKLVHNSSWQQYTLAGLLSWGPDDGSRYYLIDDRNWANPVILIGSRTKFLRQYFRFIRFGAQRIEALSSNANFDPLAFINANGKYVVVVKTTSGGAFNIHGLPAANYGLKYTTASQYDVDLEDVVITPGETLTTGLPTAGVITVFAR